MSSVIIEKQLLAVHWQSLWLSLRPVRGCVPDLLGAWSLMERTGGWHQQRSSVLAEKVGELGWGLVMPCFLSEDKEFQFNLLWIRQRCFRTGVMWSLEQEFNRQTADVLTFTEDYGRYNNKEYYCSYMDQSVHSRWRGMASKQAVLKKASYLTC